MAKAQTIKSIFSRQTTIDVVINAQVEKVWNILVNSNGYKKWNSTILSLEGNIQQGETIRLVSYLDPKRTFKLKVKIFEPNKKLVWGDMMGKRTYLLEKIDVNTKLTMTETIVGPLFPLFANKIPSFDQSFETFTNDLKKEVEK
jgi:uncharacterized protein YndB with AHSA1/START domain